MSSQLRWIQLPLAISPSSANMSLGGKHAVYRAVIDDVIKNVRSDFVADGIDECVSDCHMEVQKIIKAVIDRIYVSRVVLDELRSKWEENLKESGVMAAEPVPTLGFFHGCLLALGMYP